MTFGELVRYLGIFWRLELADVLVNQTRFGLILLAKLENLSPITNLYNELYWLFFLNQFEISLTSFFQRGLLSLTSKVVNLSWLHTESSFVEWLTLTSRRNCDTYIFAAEGILCSIAKIRVDSFDFFLLPGWAGILILEDSLLNEALHLLVMNFLFHFLQVHSILLLSCLDHGC